MGQISSIYCHPMFATKKKGKSWRTKYMKNKRTKYKYTTEKRCYKTPNGEVTNSFYKSREWMELRYKALVEHGRKCMCCGATPGDGVKLHVDHIKPRSKYPELELSLNNLQVLCEQCNVGKSNKREDDFRK